MRLVPSHHEILRLLRILGANRDKLISMHVCAGLQLSCVLYI